MKILVISPIEATALDRLRATHDVVCSYGASDGELGELSRDREAIIFRSGVSVSAAVLEHAPQLRLLIRAGSGLDNLDLDYVERRGIDLIRIPGPSAQAVAEMTFGLMLALARNIPLGDRLLRQGHWAKSELVGYNLSGKTLGVVGLGNIGTRVAQLGKAWGMQVLGCVGHPSADRREAFNAQGIRMAELDVVLGTADFVTLHVPLGATTRGLIDERALTKFKPGAFLVNVARGGVVDERALLRALTDGTLRGAALDVHESEGEGMTSLLAELPNVVLTPHIGASTIDAQREIGVEIIGIIERFLPPRDLADHRPSTQEAATR